MSYFYYFLAFAIAYVIGSIPFGYLIALSHNVDIRSVGSGNIGATNVFRTLGKKAGIFTFLLDMMKGIAATCVVPTLVQLFFKNAISTEIAKIICAVAVLLGHSFPFTLGFKGGKGVATGLGIVIGLAPITAIVGFALWIIIFLSSGYVSLGSIFAALFVGISIWFDNPDREFFYLIPTVMSILAFLVIVKHHSNIKRLIKGNENRFTFGKKKDE